MGARLPPVFQDREELAASPDLAQSVRAALEDAQTLIVVCSPNGARSKWVNEEIRTFTALGRRDQIQCLIVGGLPHAAATPGADPALECLPPALFENGGHEPLAADIRPGADGKALARLKLLAGVLGVPFDDLRQREQARRTRRLAVASGLLSVGFVVMSGLAGAALLARQEAVRQRDIARQKTVTAERTVDFVKSLFEVSDPSEAKGTTITAREILDRGAKRIDQSLSDEPSVKAELSTTLGEVYAGLGLFKQGETLITRNLALQGVDPGSRTRQYIALGDAQSRQGQYDLALKTYRTAMTLAADKRSPRPDLAARIWDGMGEAESGLNDDTDADHFIHQALTLDTARLGPNDPDVARDLEALGVNDVFAGRLKEARQPLERAVDIRRRAQGELHPRVSEDLMTLGSIAYLQQDPISAEGFFRRALASARTVLGPEHPDVASIENNLARLLLERRDYAEAKPLQEHAVAVISRERGDTFDDLAFEFDNLALIHAGTRDLAGAEMLERKALNAAQVHQSRNVAPVMVDLADARCGLGATREGLAMLDAARPIMAKAYPKDAWRGAWVDVIRGRCLLASGDRAAAVTILIRSAPAIQERWPADTLYGARVAELLAAAHVGGRAG
jgi:tetratricopeptide (TPR) repeat protein